MSNLYSQEFDYRGNDEELFKQKVDQALASLKVICGDATSKNICALAHYSPKKIKEFKRDPENLGWSNAISSDKDIVAHLTSMGGRNYKYLYIIKYGVSDNFPLYEGSANGILKEYKISCSVGPTQFIELVLIEIPGKNQYQVK